MLAAVRVEDPAGAGLGKQMGALLGGHLSRLHPFHDHLCESEGDHAVAAHRRDLLDLVLGEEGSLPMNAQGEEGRMRFEIDLLGDLDDLVDQAADDDRDPRIRLLELLEERPDRLLVGETAGDAVGLVQSGRVLFRLQAGLDSSFPPGWNR